MRKLIYTVTAILSFAVSTNAQVGVETETTTEKSILDFPNAGTKGILLPYVNDLTTAGNEPGTLAYDANTGVIKVRDNAEWKSLTDTLSDPSIKLQHDTTNYPEVGGGTVLEDGTFESVANGTVSTSADADGVLVLKTSAKALSLPKVGNVESLGLVKPGLIVYDMSRKSLAIFNGEKWALWEPAL
ncbi:hypothetical protein NMK71_03475 [Weeksellaceae bacterium KMM 9713]|uniref:Uncharacterized protein n=1 Tax=Profundicola chukchiensis TaxID=2961959 RepID=A0A9X4RX33_9FLAO|nr:hypothetical protein [Profundicola chukchiensis]MDG4945464.1 hypothetical protein [Profundicola chukchiensis]